ncbi:MAG: gephyrin-like molybdotransferase Glp [Candidatus Bathyarchaeota archaeon]
MALKLFYMSVGEADQKMLAAVDIKPKFEVIYSREAYGRILTEDISSKVDLPPLDFSHFDGYAVRAEDTFCASIGNPVLVRVVGRIHLGERGERKVNLGETCYVTTGAFLPEGANAVMMAEETAIVKSDVIKVCRAMQVGENVIPAGEDVKKDETVLEKGHVLRAQDIGLLAALRIGKVTVYRRPIVAIISTGDELTVRIEGDKPDKVVNSHSLVISELVKESGGVPVELGIVPDDLAKIKEKIEEGLRKADIVLTIGGCSLGEKDFVPRAVNLIGNPGVIIRGIKIKPGRVSSLGVVNGKPIVMLPGLIQSTIVGFHVFALPLIRLASGLPSKSIPPTLSAKISENVSFRSFTSFQQVTFVRIEKEKNRFIAEPISGESSLLSVLVNADGFIVTPENKPAIEKWEEVDVHLLNFSPFSTIPS